MGPLMRIKYPIVLIIAVVAGLSAWPKRKTAAPPIAEPAKAASSAPSAAAPSVVPSVTAPVQPQMTPEPIVPHAKAEALVNQIQRNLYKPSNDADDEQLRKSARALTPNDIRELRESTLSDQSSSESKIASVYILTQAGPAAFKALQAIAETPLNVRGPLAPHSVAEAQHKQESSLRITAMEALDTAGVDHPEIRKSFAMIFKHQTDPSLQRLALIALRGYEQGRPGKLHRYMDKMTAASN